MAIVYAAHADTIIYSDLGRRHKAGRVPLHEPLIVLSVYQNWYKIERPENISLDPDPAYPDYWVHNTDVIVSLPAPDPVPDPDPTPEPDPIPGVPTDEEAAVAVMILLKWLKG